MITVASHPEEPESKHWAAYRLTPNAATFGELLTNATDAEKPSLLSAMQRLFFETEQWRIAQHLAVLLSGDENRARGWPADQLLASYFAIYARSLSDEHPMALLVEARLHWLRRLAGAAAYDLERIRELHVIPPSLAFDRECETLLASTYAYQSRIEEAWAIVQRGIAGHAARDQLIASAAATDPLFGEIADHALKVGTYLSEHNVNKLVGHYRRRLHRILRRRCEQI